MFFLIFAAWREHNRQGDNIGRFTDECDCSEFSCIINGPSNIPTSGAKKAEAGRYPQKSGITTAEAT